LPRKATLPLALCLSALLAACATVAVAQQLTPLATGLNNPRGLAFGPNGSLYVAEAGLGAGDGQGGFGVGVGFTGAITEIRQVSSARPTSRRVVTGLASVGDTENGFPEVVGPDGISLLGKGGIYVIMAESSAGVLAANPGLDPAATAQFGRLLKVTPSGQWKATANVGEFNYSWTDAHKNDDWAPADQFPDANPYAVLALPGHQYVVDAGANTLNEVRPDGSIRLIAYFPNPLFPNPNFGQPNGGPEFIPISDAVPTCIAQGPDGFLYVGTLAFGANFARFGGPPPWATLPKQSKVYRVNPTSSKFFLTDDDVWADNLNPITGCGFGPGGFYVTEYVTEESGYQSGDVVRIAVNLNGTAGTRTALGVGVLNAPNSFACGRDGSIYVSNNSTSAGVGPVVGEVVRVNY
jgi:hypothetical protein